MKIRIERDNSGDWERVLIDGEEYQRTHSVDLRGVLALIPGVEVETVYGDFADGGRGPFFEDGEEPS